MVSAWHEWARIRQGEEHRKHDFLHTRILSLVSNFFQAALFLNEHCIHKMSKKCFPIHSVHPSLNTSIICDTHLKVHANEHKDLPCKTHTHIHIHTFLYLYVCCYHQRYLGPGVDDCTRNKRLSDGTKLPDRLVSIVSSRNGRPGRMVSFVALITAYM